MGAIRTPGVIGLTPSDDLLGSWPTERSAAPRLDPLGPYAIPGVAGFNTGTSLGRTQVSAPDAVRGEGPVPTRIVEVQGVVVRVKWSRALMNERRMAKLEAQLTQLQTAADQAAGGTDPKAARAARDKAARASMLMEWEQQRAEEAQEQVADEKRRLREIEDGWEGALQNGELHG